MAKQLIAKIKYNITKIIVFNF